MDLTTRPTLLERLRNPADQEAWREFNVTYRGLILAYCRRRGLQETDADDICQWVMLGLARTLGSFQYDPERGRFRSYLGRTVAHAIARHAPATGVRGRELDPKILDELATSGPNEIDEDWEHEWMLHHYRLAIASVRETFDPTSLQVFDHLRDGHTVDSASRQFGLSTQAVYKIKQRIRLRLVELIEAQIREEDGIRG